MSGISDPIADMLTRVRNALMARHEQLAVPASNLKIKIADILQAEGYIEGYRVEDDPRQRMIYIVLKYINRDDGAITALKRISRPGRRVYAKAAKLPRVRNGLGVAIISTSQGLMSDKEARRQGLGGEVLCEVW